jgi:hypothetical protein
MRIVCTIISLFFAPFAFGVETADTGKLVIDIRRVKLHEDIDQAQRRICELDARNDNFVSLSGNADIDLQLTDIYTRQTDELQRNIELESGMDHRIKVKYLTGLNLLLDGFLGNVGKDGFVPPQGLLLFDAYRKYMKADLDGYPISAMMQSFPYDINRILLGENSVFFENKGLSQARINLFKQFGARFPEKVLPRIGPYLEQPFADTLLIAAAYADPEEFYNYAAAKGTPTGKKIRLIKEPLVALITKMSDDPSGRLYFPFSHAILKGSLKIDSIRQVLPQPQQYFKLLVKTQISYLEDKRLGITPLLFEEIGTMIRRKAEEIYINEVNALHDDPDEIRFRILENLTPEELYYIIVTGEDVLYTSSYTGTYARMMAKLPQGKGDQLLLSVHFDRFRKFIRMAAAYNRLDAFLSSMSAEHASLLMKAFVRGLDKGLNLEDAVDVADSYASINDPEIKSLIVKEVNANLHLHTSKQNQRGEIIYDILNLLFRSVNDSSDLITTKYGVPPAYSMMYDQLADSMGRVVQQVYFYGDKDGIESFANFMATFRGKKEWRIIQNDNWVDIRSSVGKPVWIFANLPLDNSKGDDPDAAAQEKLSQYLKSIGLQPTIVIHRGHSYHLKYTLQQLSKSAKIVILGSCGSYQNLNAVLQICPEAHIVSSKEVGTKLVNEPVLKIISDTLREGAMINWLHIWRQLEKMLNSGSVKERLDNYIPPHKNLGALFIKAYYNGVQ